MDLQKEREAFEQHLTDTGLVEFSDYGFAVDECDEYLHEPTQVAWDSWLIGLNRAKAQAIPDGFVVVPKEPTDAMLDAGMRGFYFPLDNGRFYTHDLIFAYRAMIEAAQEPTPLKVGDLVEPKDYRYTLASGACRYPCAYVVNTNPFQLMSEEGDMYWCCTVEADGYKLLKSNVQLPKGVVDRMIREGLIAPVEAQEPAND